MLVWCHSCVVPCVERDCGEGKFAGGRGGRGDIAAGVIDAAFHGAHLDGLDAARDGLGAGLGHLRGDVKTGADHGGGVGEGGTVFGSHLVNSDIAGCSAIAV